MQKPNSTGLWRKTPPAIFPPILGMFALGLAWRRAGDMFFVPSGVGEAILGGVSLLFLLAVIAYLAKFIRRPTTLTDDLRILPGRAGVSAASVGAMLFAATLLDYSGCAAWVVVVLALIVHGVIASLVVFLLSSAPLEQRRITPVWHLTFVGFIVAPLAAIPLGAVQLSELILFITMPLSLVIWGSHVYLMSKRAVPPPLRPILAIHLAPICLFGIVSTMLGYATLGTGFGWLAIGLMSVAILRIPYLTAAGFSPLWGAFTFPMSAFANLMLILAPTGGPFYIIGGLALIGATLAVPMIAYKIMQLWASGELAVKTNASAV